MADFVFHGFLRYRLNFRPIFFKKKTGGFLRLPMPEKSLKSQKFNENLKSRIKIPEIPE
jgi:hypothetical protein